MYLEISRFHRFGVALRAAEKDFHFGSDFHVSSDPQIHGFRVPLRAAEWFFNVVLIFKYL